MKALLDTDVILDILFNRRPFAIEASEIWRLYQANAFDACMSAITPVNVFYIGRRLRDTAAARQAVAVLMASLPVCPVDDAVLRAALSSPFSDYEDAVQHSCAILSNADAIVTRNGRDYVVATVTVFSPGDFLHHLSTLGNT